MWHILKGEHVFIYTTNNNNINSDEHIEYAWLRLVGNLHVSASVQYKGKRKVFK